MQATRPTATTAIPTLQLRPPAAPVRGAEVALAPRGPFQPQPWAPGRAPGADPASHLRAPGGGRAQPKPDPGAAPRPARRPRARVPARRPSRTCPAKGASASAASAAAAGSPAPAAAAAAAAAARAAPGRQQSAGRSRSSRPGAPQLLQRQARPGGGPGAARPPRLLGIPAAGPGRPAAMAAAAAAPAGSSRCSR